ncbi:hypothetical protein [Longimicrobium sp.]|uniref:hypothetical protein n=1 Tax=Longimicrobium sp. TaxID=2029185 RepID=UPI002C31B00F|nr:hypothetical protein [Longimicrobium sp.]HSU18091.1 hypothetical protein [Longimicrobium sp.]
MRPSALVLSTFLLSACSVAVNTGPGAPGMIGRAFAGSWKGTGSQSDHPGEWSIALTLADGARDAVVGTITYPSLDCGGDLLLRRADGGRMELRERITFGECVDHGIVTLTPASGGGLDYAWRVETGELAARGTLSRATPPPEP